MVIVMDLKHFLWHCSICESSKHLFWHWFSEHQSSVSLLLSILGDQCITAFALIGPFKHCTKSWFCWLQNSNHLFVCLLAKVPVSLQDAVILFCLLWVQHLQMTHTCWELLCCLCVTASLLPSTHCTMCLTYASHHWAKIGCGSKKSVLKISQVPLFD